MVHSASAAGPNTLNRPLYTYAESDRLARVTPGTSKRWLEGYSSWDQRGTSYPPVTIRPRALGAVSFLDLAEVAAIGRLRNAGFSLRLIRQIVQNSSQLFHTDRPLITVKFKHDGREIFADQGESLLEVGKRRGEQAWNDFLEPFLDDLDYENDLARRWYPLGKGKLVVVDPDYSFGLPTLKDLGIRTEVIFERILAEEPIAEIAKDLDIPQPAVEQAIHYETRLMQRAA